MIFTLCACGNTDTADFTEPDDIEILDGGDTVANPITSVSSLEELNKILGSKMASPPVMGITDESFSTIEAKDFLIGEYDFSVNGRACIEKFVCNSTEDISGFYIDGEQALDGIEEGTNVKLEDGMLTRWFTLEGQYVLYVSGNDFDEDWFNGIKDEIKDLTASSYTENEISAFYSKIAGNYMDSTSQRAAATVEAKEDCVSITITWSDSATITNIWTMNAKLYEDGLLSYSDCEHSTEDYSNEDAPVRTVVYSDGEGFFTPTDDGLLLWNGAQDENCTNCSFEPVS